HRTVACRRPTIAMRGRVNRSDIGLRLHDDPRRQPLLRPPCQCLADQRTGNLQRGLLIACAWQRGKSGYGHLLAAPPLPRQTISAVICADQLTVLRVTADSEPMHLAVLIIS